MAATNQNEIRNPKDVTIEVNNDAQLGRVVEVGADGHLEEVGGHVSTFKSANRTHLVPE
jgi:hypothetical protein